MNTLLDYPALLRDYARYHATPGNRATHMIGIPLIVFAIVKWTLVGPGVPLAAVFLPVYFAWDKRVGLVMTAFLAACAWAGAAAPGWTAWAAFVTGWAFQLAGHKVYEKNAPALLDNLVHALVGPAFIAAKVFGLK